MKKTFRILAIFMIIAMLSVMLVSCSKRINGKYSAEVDLGLAKGMLYYEFDGDNVTITTVSNIIGYEKSESVSGTYEILESSEKEGELLIRFTIGDDVETYSFAEGDNFIVINGTTFNKVD